MSADPSSSTPAARILAIFLAALGTLVGCATVPNVDGLIGKSSTGAAPPDIRGANGPLTAKQSNAILRRLERDARNTDVLQRHLALENALADSPLVAGNKVTLLRNGPATFAAMFDAMRQAKNDINLEYFIFQDVEEGGQHLGDLLAEKQRQGVQVNVIYDSFGSLGTPQTLFDRLRAAGVNLLEFHPVNPLDAKRAYSLNDRDHRKILIVDGSTAIIGGVNLSSVYSSRPLRFISGSEEVQSETWRDTDLRIAGPAVAELQKLFVLTWTREEGQPLKDRNYFPHIDAQGNEVVRIIGSAPHHSLPEYYVSFLSAVSNAETRIWVTAAYFVPTEEERRDLMNAARRGVDVTLLLPSRSDSELALEAGRHYFSDLLEAGVKIYETEDYILHSKSAVIDGVWSVIGSSNLDYRSVLFNNEVDAVILGRETARQFEAMFKDDLSHARRVDKKAWEERPLSERVKELFARAVQVLL